MTNLAGFVAKLVNLRDEKVARLTVAALLHIFKICPFMAEICGNPQKYDVKAWFVTGGFCKIGKFA